MRYYIADCHFYHKNLLTEMDNCGFESVKQDEQSDDRKVE